MDFRSDTITQPTKDMREVICNAKCGDDVMEEDPTVIELQNYVADLFGMEGALYVCSGVMANQIAIKTWTVPGEEVLLDPNYHVAFYESGAAAVISGTTFRYVDSDNGVFSSRELDAAMRPSNIHFPPSKLVIVENTANRYGGNCWDMESLVDVRNFCNENKLKLHCDGARLWNASVATRTPLVEFGRLFDSISVCTSKGLGAPIGSVLLGSSQFIQKARAVRKMLGGGWRQAGLIASASLFAVKHNIERLKEDHENAKLAQIVGLTPRKCMTNIVIVEIEGMTADQFVEECMKSGIQINSTSPTSVRFVTSMEVSREIVEKAALKIHDIMQKTIVGE